ncbi:MAG: hypothetical protein IKX26_08460 [Bacteroidales bacterium]|nr:hypothetical protein [Bacteroidales bacterium]
MDVKTLENRLQILIDSKRSGILYKHIDGEQAYGLVYLHPLKTLLALDGDLGKQYGTVTSGSDGLWLIKHYAGYSDNCYPSGADMEDSEYLSERFSDLLWMMSHDTMEMNCMEDKYDTDSFDYELGLMGDNPGWDRVFSFKLMGKDTYENDYNAFWESFRDNKEFSVTDRDGNTQNFIADVIKTDDGDFIFRLSVIIRKPYVNRQTGKTRIRTRRKALLYTLSLPTLYAKSWTLVFKKYLL